MGYTTDFTLSIECDMNAELGLETNKDQEKEIIKAIRDMDPKQELYLSEFIDKDESLIECIDGWKWYEHEDDMRELSRRCGDILFKLTGVGEDYEDFWEKYFLNGKMQECRGRVVYDKFNPDEMK